MGLLSKLKKAFGDTGPKVQDNRSLAVIQEKEKRIAELEQQISHLTESTMTDVSKVQAKDHEIDKLMGEIAGLRRAAANSEKNVKERDERIARLEREIASLKAKPQSPAPASKTSSPPPASQRQPVQNVKPAIKPSGDDPYQKLGQELVDAFKKTTRPGDEKAE